MEKFMTANPETILFNSEFIKSQMRQVPSIYWANLSKEEIKSELDLTICNCCKYYDPNRGPLFYYVKRSFHNALRRLLDTMNYQRKFEVPLEYAYGASYETKEVQEQESSLMAYLKDLPSDLIPELTDFVLGKKNKEELTSNPSFKKVNIDRILSNLDHLLC